MRKMNEAGLKEKILVSIAGMIILYAIAVVAWFLYFEGSWRAAARKCDRERARYEREAALIGERERWDLAYESEKAAMPVFEGGKATDTVYLERIETLAREHRVLITQIDAGEEIQADDVLELPIEVKSFESSLEALVKFMYALESTTNGMFDVKTLSVQPNKSKPGYLRGSFSLTSAYMREN